MATAPKEAETSRWWKAPWAAADDPDRGWPEQAQTKEDAWHYSPDGLHLDENSVIAPMERRYDQVRSRVRVKALAEVFTNDREINAILDMCDGSFDHLDVKFLEPSAGSGNFLVAILSRKLTLVRAAQCSTQEQYEHQLLRAVASIYGIDIADDNVAEARARLAHQLLTHYATDAPGIEPTLGFQNAAGIVLEANIVVGDTLSNAHTIELCDWKPSSGGRFQRVWSFALVPYDERGLFWEERLEDSEPVHYSDLASPAPARRKTRKASAS